MAKKKRAVQKQEREREAAERARAEEQRRKDARKRKRRSLAKARAAVALETFITGVDNRLREGQVQTLKAAWHRAKEAAREEYGDDDAWLAMLETIADAAGTDWDIAYSSPSQAVA